MKSFEIKPGMVNPSLLEDYPEYQASCCSIITRDVIPRFPGHDPELILKLNTPFDWPPKAAKKEKKEKIGILMVHGMYGSPFSMRDLGQYFQHHGLHARSITLPGHCSLPKHLTRIDLEDFQLTVKKAVETFSKEVDTIYLLGFSFGGSLILDYYHHLADNKMIAGLIPLAPALKLRSRLAWTLPCLEKLKFYKYYEHGKEVDHTRYLNLATHSGHQVYRIIKKLQKCPRLITDKLFLATASDDEVVTPKTIKSLFDSSHTKSKKLLVYRPGKNEENDNIIFRNATYPNYNVANFSHINMLFSLHNIHYGINGDYPRHVITKGRHKHKKVVFGALNKETLGEYNVMRASFNPDFEFFANTLLEFITSEANTPDATD
jgi:esterase/lipase